MELLWNFISDSNDRETKVLEFHHPEQLMNIMDFTLPDSPKNLQEVLNDCRQTLKYQVKTGEDFFYKYSFECNILFTLSIKH